MKLTSRKDLIALRERCAAAIANERKRILVCAGTGCASGGSLDIYARLKALMAQRGIPCSVELADEPHGEVVGLKKCGCHGFCEMGPLVRIEPRRAGSM